MFHAYLYDQLHECLILHPANNFPSPFSPHFRHGRIEVTKVASVTRGLLDTCSVEHGYGYANLSKALKKNIDKIIEDYFLYRKQIRLIFLIIDIRHDPLEIDLAFISWLISRGKRFTLIFSKCDKLKNEKVQAQKYMTKIKNKFNETPKYFITSSKKKVGIKEILTHINGHNNL